MTHSTADIIRKLLIDLSLGAESGTEFPIFTGFLPDATSDAICVYDTVGIVEGRLMSDGEVIEHPGIQIRVCSISYPKAQSKIKAIADAISAQNRTLVTVETSEYRIQNISRSAGIMSVGMEDADLRRHHFTLNATTTINQET